MTKSVKIARTLAIILALIATVWSFYLFFYGTPSYMYPESPPGASRSEIMRTVVVSRHAVPQAFLAACASFLILLGLVIRRMPVAWFGEGALCLFTAILFFSLGGQYLPIVIVLGILLAFVQIRQQI